MKIGTAIKKLRKELTPKVTQGDLALVIGISQTYLSQVEGNLKEPSLDVLMKISEYFNKPLPIIFWFSLEESDIDDYKKEYFRLLKPSIDKLIESLL